VFIINPLSPLEITTPPRGKTLFSCLLLNIPKPSKRGGLGGEKPEEPAYGTSWLYL
jgi:hypothetical protein